MQALINSSGFVQCWCISNRVHKPMLSDFLIDCSENRGVKKIYKRNSKAITQFFDGWNGDALLGGIKHTVNGGRSDTGTDSKGLWDLCCVPRKALWNVMQRHLLLLYLHRSLISYVCSPFFVDISGNRLFLCTARRIFKNDVPEILPRKSTDRKTRKGILHLVNGRYHVFDKSCYFNHSILPLNYHWVKRVRHHFVPPPGEFSAI